MSVAYEPRSFHDDNPYAPVGESDHDHDHSDLNKYINTEANVDDMADLAAVAYAQGDSGTPSPFNPADSPPTTLDLVGPVAPPNVDPANVPIRESSPVLLGIPGMRSKPIAKPDRMVTKNEEGLYECRWEDCKEDAKTFHRKCEWSKHMDKHERPYVCTVKGCEKIQGFTYSGGLLRHEREVHGKHGGPKKALNCPHTSCKRNTGKGFSRMENLQEHLRRCHRRPSAHSSTPGGGGSGGSGSGLTGNTHSHKRKRSDDDESDDFTRAKLLQAENDRLQEENKELLRQLHEQTRTANDMRTQLQALQATINAALSVQQPPI
ncbi:hypothetical protein BD289DRAFT_373828 [Coniella lustricola]|uniref:C2H2-type domain-containing protein n=1 Tax=Coniella lustricola TaxID=2025994 RepID=A0A2T3A0H5_9PEZI|nr:hypothetical protein BD289DRAFT_373828 [Coniella lustricola]